MAAPLNLLSLLRDVSRRALLCTGVLLLICCGALADDDGAVDLQGILPDYIPNGLTGSDFSQLGDDWAAWGTETSRLVAEFYTSDDPAIRGRRATLQTLRSRLGAMQAALVDPSQSADYGPLADLYGQLSRRLAVSEALLETIDRRNDPELRDAASVFLQAIEDYESEPDSPSMEAIRNHFDTIRRLAVDNAPELTVAMRHHFLNYNLRVIMNESLMQDIMRDTRMESGYINEMVSGARITGCQWTNTTASMDLKPSDTGVRFELILNGTVRSRAQGETHLATVYATGRHCFRGRKQILFDGDRFQHWRAAVGSGGASSPYAADTCLSWAPLLGRASEKLALRVATDKASDANAETLGRIRREVGTQFDRETGRMLRQAELSLQEKVAGPLRKGGYFPDTKSFQSTETEMSIRTRTMEAGELGGGERLLLPIGPVHGVLMQVHQSLMNQVGDRIGLDGKRLTPEELKQHLQSELEAITGSPVDLSDLTAGAQADGDSPTVEEIIFHEADSIRAQIRGGEVVLILSVGLKLQGREEVPPQRISVPLNFELDGDKIVMRRGTVGVSPIGPIAPRERGQQIARAGIMRSKIQEAFEPREFDSIFTVDAGEKQVTLQVTDLRARGGWLSIIATDGISQSDQGDPSDPSDNPPDDPGTIEPTPRPLPQAAADPGTLVR